EGRGAGAGATEAVRDSRRVGTGYADSDCIASGGEPTRARPRESQGRTARSADGEGGGTAGANRLASWSDGAGRNRRNLDGHRSCRGNEIRQAATDPSRSVRITG